MSELTNHQKSVPETNKNDLACYFSAISRINQNFYDAQAQSFSDTRTHGWPGWVRLDTHITREVYDFSNAGSPYVVADIACGNLRFGRFLMQRHPTTSFEFHAYDACKELLDLGVAWENSEGSEDALAPHISQSSARASSPVNSISPQRAHTHLKPVVYDVMGALITSYLEQGADTLLPSPSQLAPHLIACFGFMHHIPTQALRIHFLKTLCSQAPSGALVALSFWEFLKDGTRASKAYQAHTEALNQGVLPEHLTSFLEAHDLFLGWSNQKHAARFCHAFTSDELDGIIDALADTAVLIDRYVEDGKTHDLNEYLIMRVR